MYKFKTPGLPGKVGLLITCFRYFLLIFFFTNSNAQSHFSGFTTSSYFNEQVLSFHYYYGPRAYTKWIQPVAVVPGPLLIPPRSPLAMTGSQFMQYVLNMNFEQRESAIYTEISAGNIPDFLRTLTQITNTFQDTQGNNHTVTYQVMPDYLAIGSDEDFYRIPMGPLTAQRLADLFGATMPTAKLVDDIYRHATVKLAPVTYTPVGNQNELVPKFVEHNQAIETQRIAASGQLGQLTGGTKKDVVISNLILDPTRPNHVVIYGWHQLNGLPIQPLTNIHINSYMDYSHGIRLLNNQILLDSSIASIRDILTDPGHYRLLSNETGVMVQPGYPGQVNQPAQPKSFGIKSEGADRLRILIKSDPVVTDYKIFLSRDGQNFDPPLLFPPGDFVLENLDTDSLYYIKIKAMNTAVESPESELLAGVQGVINPAMDNSLIPNTLLRMVLIRCASEQPCLL